MRNRAGNGLRAIAIVIGLACIHTSFVAKATDPANSIDVATTVDAMSRPDVASAISQRVTDEADFLSADPKIVVDRQTDFSASVEMTNSTAASVLSTTATAMEKVPMPPTGVRIVTPHGPLWVWVQGSWSTRQDMFYQSVDIKSWAWVTEGSKAGDPKFAVDELEASFSCPCASETRAWPNESHVGIHFYQRHKGPFPPGRGMCLPTSVCFVGCATIDGKKWCAKTKTCG